MKIKYDTIFSDIIIILSSLTSLESNKPRGPLHTYYYIVVVIVARKEMHEREMKETKE